MIVILMGVSGSGKTTVGRHLAEKLGWPLLDADDFHPPANIEKMSRGVPLEDGDRWPWLDRINAVLAERQQRAESALLACSALKQVYRDRLSKGIPDPRWIYLKGNFDLIRERLEARKGHYMKAGLLESQFATLEEPGNALSVDIDGTPDAIADSILLRLQASPARRLG